MADVKRMAAVLLAAGSARRFGGGKLAQPFDGEPLGLRAARTLAGVGFGRLVAVVADDSVDYARAGFQTVRNAPGSPMSSSLRLGIAACAEWEACLVALADMPLVPAAHFAALAAAHEGAVTATLLDGEPVVPAVFGAAEFGRLMALEGDHGAQRLLGRAKGVAAEAEWLADVDTPEDLARLAR